jgi:translation initiation factor IF-2
VGRLHRLPLLLLLPTLLPPLIPSSSPPTTDPLAPLPPLPLQPPLPPPPPPAAAAGLGPALPTGHQRGRQRAGEELAVQPRSVQAGGSRGRRGGGEEGDQAVLHRAPPARAHAGGWSLLPLPSAQAAEVVGEEHAVVAGHHQQGVAGPSSRGGGGEAGERVQARGGRGLLPGDAGVGAGVPEGEGGAFGDGEEGVVGGGWLLWGWCDSGDGVGM